jgi:hypothetical protein
VVGGILSAVPGAKVSTKAAEIAPVSTPPTVPVLLTSGEVTFAR